MRDLEPRTDLTVGSRRLDEAPRDLPARIEPMMLTHLVLSGDLAQQRAWRDQIEAIRQVQAIDAERDPELRSLLLRDRVWQRMRATGRAAAAAEVALSSVWLAWLLPTYAIGHGFGWLAALTFLLPIPVAWKVARRLFERSALHGMRALVRRDRPRSAAAARLWALAESLPRAATAGFAFGFVLVLLQAAISVFMTPAPTVALELLWDLADAVRGGLVAAGASTLLAPFLSRPPPK